MATALADVPIEASCFCRLDTAADEPLLLRPTEWERLSDEPRGPDSSIPVPALRKQCCGGSVDALPAVDHECLAGGTSGIGRTAAVLFAEELCTRTWPPESGAVSLSGSRTGTPVPAS